MVGCPRTNLHSNPVWKSKLRPLSQLPFNLTMLLNIITTVATAKRVQRSNRNPKRLVEGCGELKIEFVCQLLVLGLHIRALSLSAASQYLNFKLTFLNRRMNPVLSAIPNHHCVYLFQP